MVCSDDVGIEDEAIESSRGYSEIAFEHDNDKSNPCHSKWDEKKNIDIGTMHTLRCSKSQTKTGLTGSTQDSTAVECTLLVLFIQADVIVLRLAVVKWTVCVDYHIIRIVSNPN